MGSPVNTTTSTRRLTRLFPEEHAAYLPYELLYVWFLLPLFALTFCFTTACQDLSFSHQLTFHPHRRAFSFLTYHHSSFILYATGNSHLCSLQTINKTTTLNTLISPASHNDDNLLCSCSPSHPLHRQVRPKIDRSQILLYSDH